MASIWRKVWKCIRNVADDFLLLIVTTVGVLTTSYLPTIRDALTRHPPASELQWPEWYIVAIAGFVALIVTMVDASRGTLEQKKQRVGQRIVQNMLLGMGALSLLEKIVGGGA